MPDDVLELQQLAFRYFLDHTNAKNGLVADNTREDSPCSIAATGLGLSCHPVAVMNGWLKRADAAERVLTALRFFEHSPQGPEPDVTGYKGFYYHFLEMKDGRRAGECELSTVDSAFLLAGMLAAAAFFDADAPAEREIRETADALYRRADWQWALVRRSVQRKRLADQDRRRCHDHPRRHARERLHQLSIPGIR